MIKHKSARTIKKINMFLIKSKSTDLKLRNLSKELDLRTVTMMREPKLNIRVRFRANLLQNLLRTELPKVKRRQASRCKSRVKVL